MHYLTRFRTTFLWCTIWPGFGRHSSDALSDQVTDVGVNFSGDSNLEQTLLEEMNLLENQCWRNKLRWGVEFCIAHMGINLWWELESRRLCWGNTCNMWREMIKFLYMPGNPLGKMIKSSYSTGNTLLCTLLGTKPRVDPVEERNSVVKEMLKK